MRFPFFDLHCDTATAMLERKEKLTQNSLAVSLEKAKGFDRYIQVMAIWTDRRLEDEAGWHRLHEVLAYLQADEAVQSGKAETVTECPKNGVNASLLLAVEDARILNGRIERIHELYRLGFRIITPLWAGETCIGGAHDTKTGLTEFGKDAVRESVRLGFLPDVSHASEKSADEIFEIAAKHCRPVMASHSNAYALCPVSRNLRPTQIQSILDLDGVIGINLYRNFLSKEQTASREDVLRHTEYFLEHGCENALCFGGDMDGADLPADIPDLSAIPSLREFLSRYYSEELLNKLFFENAYDFAERYLTPSAKNL